MTRDPMTIADRYAHAAVSGDLTPRHERRTDADVLLAAAIASSGRPERSVALTIYRAAVTGDLSCLPGAVTAMADWIILGAQRRLTPRPARIAIAQAVAAWYVDPTCRYCAGRGYEVDEASGRTTRECTSCAGTGKRALEIPVQHQQAGRRLAARLDEHLAWIHDEMARRLRGVLG